MNPFLEAALEYARAGQQVFPAVPNQKIPLTKHGCLDATTDEARIHTWWERWPNANVAMATSEDICVIDVDVSETGEYNGWEDLKEFPPLPKTVRQNTPRGGAHFFFRADNNPPANKNKFRPGIDIRGKGFYVIMAPSIHPNGNRYQWAPGQGLGEIELAEFPDFLRPPTRPPWAAKPVQQVPMAPLGPANSDALQRASAYLATCDPAIEGQAGHSSLLWAASSIMYRFGLSDSEVYDLLVREYNGRCIPPWDLGIPKDEKDFRRKITEARKNPPAIVHEWAQEAALERGEVSQVVRDGVAEMLGSFNTKQQNNEVREVDSEADTISEEPSQFETRRLPRELLEVPGFINEYIKYCMEAAPYPNAPLALAGGLALLSSITREIKGPGGIKTNLYVVGLAPSGAGKNFPRTTNSQLLAEAGAVDMLAEDIASAEGLEDLLAVQPAILDQPDEFDSMILAMEKPTETRYHALASSLNNIYTSSGSVRPRRAKATKDNKPPPIYQPHLTLFATAIPEHFYKAVGNRLLTIGFLGRTFPIEADPRSKGQSPGDKPLPVCLIEQVKYWIEFRSPNSGKLDKVISSSYSNPTPTAVPITPAAQEALEAFQAITDEQYAAFLKIGDEGPMAIWSRVHALALKLATLYAVSENYHTPKIDLPAVEWAKGVAEWQAKGSLALVAEYSTESPFHEGCKKFKRFLKKLSGEKGEWVSRREISRRMHCDVGMLNKYVAALIDQGRIEQRIDSSRRGPNSVEYRSL